MLKKSINEVVSKELGVDANIIGNITEYSGGQDIVVEAVKPYTTFQGNYNDISFADLVEFVKNLVKDEFVVQLYRREERCWTVMCDTDPLGIYDDRDYIETQVVVAEHCTYEEAQAIVQARTKEKSSIIGAYEYYMRKEVM